MNKDREDVRLVIVGPDNEGYQIRVEQMLKTYGVRDKTIFTGLLSGQREACCIEPSGYFRPAIIFRGLQLCSNIRGLSLRGSSENSSCDNATSQR